MALSAARSRQLQPPTGGSAIGGSAAAAATEHRRRRVVDFAKDLGNAFIRLVFFAKGGDFSPAGCEAITRSLQGCAETLSAALKPVGLRKDNATAASGSAVVPPMAPSSPSRT